MPTVIMSKSCQLPDAQANRGIFRMRLVVLAYFLMTGAWQWLAPLSIAAVPAVPQIDEQGWWQIAGNPDLGELSSDKQEPVDFGIWQAADNTWQLCSCIRNTKEAGVTRLFYRWEGKKLSDTNWQPMGVAMRSAPKYGEKRGGLQALFVTRQGDRWLMFYGDWVNICLAESEDGKTFRRAAIDGKGPQLFTEGEGNNTRRPHVAEVR